MPADNAIVNDALGSVIPAVNGGDIVGFIGIFLSIILIGIVLAIVSVWLIQYLKFNKNIVLFKKYGDRTIIIARDRAVFERVGQAGDYWCRTKKIKKIVPRPHIMTGKNTYWFFEREDGEWINFTLADLDMQMRKAKAHYIDEDMRLHRIGIQKNLRERFQKVTFWEKYGGMISFALFIVIITVCLVVLFEKMSDGWNQASQMAEAVREMARQVQNMRGTGAVAGLVVPSFLKGRKNLE